LRDHAALAPVPLCEKFANFRTFQAGGVSIRAAAADKFSVANLA
jgi:hypothetical protein